MPALLAVGLCAFMFADIRTARALLEQGKTIDALKELQAALRSAPDDPEVQFEAGELLREIGAQRAAELERVAPESAEAHELVGRSFESRGRLDEALAEYRIALNEPNAALEHLKRAVEADDSSIEAHRELGRVYRLIGDHRAALNQFRIV